MGKKVSEKPEGFVLYAKTLQSLCLLPAKNAGRVLLAAARLFLDGQEPEGLDLSEQIVFSLLRDDMNAALERHTAVCARNRQIAAKRKAPGATTRDDSSPNAPNMNTNTNTNTNTNPNTNPSTSTSTSTNPSQKEKKADRPPAHARGQYGWVKLTDEQYAQLLADLGEDEAKRCIAYIDEAAQSTGNKNRWKDWNLVVRKCSREKWGGAEGHDRGKHTSSAAGGPAKRFNIRYDVE